MYRLLLRYFNCYTYITFFKFGEDRGKQFFEYSEIFSKNHQGGISGAKAKPKCVRVPETEDDKCPVALLKKYLSMT